MPSTTTFLLPYLDLDLTWLGLYLGFENILGVILVADPAKYKSISVNRETYEKIVEIANAQRRNISQQLSLLVDKEYEDLGFDVKAKPARIYAGGLSAVIED